MKKKNLTALHNLTIKKLKQSYNLTSGST